MAVREIRFDDVAALDALKTDEWGDWSESFEITQDVIQAFAELSGDHQWIHVDVERARKESPFGGPIAHGFLTLAILPRLARTERALQITGYRNAVNYGSDGLRFLAPVPAGASIHARGRPRGASQHRSGTLVRSETAVHVVGSERPSLLYTSLILYQG